MSKFSSLLLQLPDDFKKYAGIESADEIQLEQDFANMAFAFLQDRARDLLPYLLGFEVVEREEDGSKAIGIFGFKVGDEYYYVPSFFTNGQVRGMDLLFSKRTNSFIPLREAWINYILNRQAITLGRSAPNPRALQNDLEHPDFDFVASPPNIKRGGDVHEITHDGFDTWNALQKSAVDALDNDNDFREAFACAISRVEGSELPLDKSAESDLTRWLNTTGGLRAMDALTDHIQKQATYGDAMMQFYTGLTELVDAIGVTGDPTIEKHASEFKVITTPESDSDGTTRQTLVRDGFAVIDKRRTESKSELLDVDYAQSFTNPTGSGRYNILLRTGAVKDAWVCEGTAGFPAYIVVDPTNRAYFIAETAAVLLEGGPESDKTSVYDAAGVLNRMKPDHKYILVDATGKATAPFIVKSIITENRRRTQIKIRWTDYVEHKAGNYSTGSAGRANNYVGATTGVEFLQFATHKGELTQAGRKLVVPENWKALEVHSKDDYELFSGTEQPAYDTDAYKTYEKKRDTFRNAIADFAPGDIVDLSVLIQKQGMCDLVIESDPVCTAFNFTLNGFNEGPYGYKTAAVRLAKDYCVDGSEAVDLLRQAQVSGKVKCFIKFAQGVGAFIPEPPPQAMGYDDYSDVPIQYGQTGTYSGHSVGMPQVDYSLAGNKGMHEGAQVGGGSGGYQADQEAMDLAIQAGRAGQRHIFDHATIGGLSRLYDPSSVIDSYIPDLSKALDRIGRILFIFYWKNEEFSDRYGSEDMGEMEDTLRGVFKSFGDLVLKLRQKSVDVETGTDAITRE